MQEDVMGQLAVAGDRGYTTCEECGSVFRRETGEIQESGLNDGAHSELTELCPDCASLDRQGEMPVATGPERA